MLKLNISSHICISKIKYSLTLNVTDMIFKTIPSLISTTAYCQWHSATRKKRNSLYLQGDRSGLRFSNLADVLSLFIRPKQI